MIIKRSRWALVGDSTRGYVGVHVLVSFSLALLFLSTLAWHGLRGTRSGYMAVETALSDVIEFKGHSQDMPGFTMRYEMTFGWREVSIVQARPYTTISNHLLASFDCLLLIVMKLAGDCVTVAELVSTTARRFQLSKLS